MANIWPDEPTLFLAQNTADVWFSSIHSLIQSAYKYWNRLTSVCCQLMLKPRMAPSRPSPGLFPSNFRMRPRICIASVESHVEAHCVDVVHFELGLNQQLMSVRLFGIKDPTVGDLTSTDIRTSTQYHSSRPFRGLGTNPIGEDISVVHFTRSQSETTH